MRISGLALCPTATVCSLLLLQPRTPCNVPRQGPGNEPSPEKRLHSSCFTNQCWVRLLVLRPVLLVFRPVNLPNQGPSSVPCPWSTWDGLAWAPCAKPGGTCPTVGGQGFFSCAGQGTEKAGQPKPLPAPCLLACAPLQLQQARNNPKHTRNLWGAVALVLSF